METGRGELRNWMENNVLRQGAKREIHENYEWEINGEAGEIEIFICRGE